MFNFIKNEELRNEYENNVEILPERFTDTIIYKNYLSKFDTSDLNLLLPFGLNENIDIDLLIKFIISSFSCFYRLKEDWKTWKRRVVITVGSTEKNLEDLQSFQFAEMYDTFVEEQIKREIAKTENKKRKKIVENGRDELPPLSYKWWFRS